MDKKAIIFDMDGVIFDSERMAFNCWEKAGRHYGLSNIWEIYHKVIGVNAAETKAIVLEEYGEGFDFEKFSAEASMLFHEAADKTGLPVKKGVWELLSYLKEKQIPLGLASSTRLAIVEAELKQAGLYHYFSVIVGGDLLKRSKPAPDIYLMACEKMGVAPEGAYAIEDSHNGIRSAYAAGMLPIMVPDMLEATEEMRQKSIVVLNDLLQVKDWLEALEERDGIS